MSSNARKYLVFGLVFAVWLALDLWTKHWADVSLGDAYHPLPVSIQEAEVGKPLGAVLAARFGGTEAEAPERYGRWVEELPPLTPLGVADAVYAPDGPAARASGFYIFWRGDETLPPRRVDRIERVLLSNWLRMAVPKADVRRLRASVQDALSTLTFAEWLPERLTRLSEDRVEEVATSRMHAVVRGPAVPMERVVAAGEEYLLTLRRIDVSGDWFKLLYAENPGAAFGFLRDLEPDLRHAIFLFLTLVAFLVILSLTFRMPAEARAVNIAMAGILSGAVGNFVDRIRYGYVIDFIDMDLGFMHWPTYNVADIAITVGVVLLLLDMIFNKESPLLAPPEEPAADPAEDPANVTKGAAA